MKIWSISFILILGACTQSALPSPEVQCLDLKRSAKISVAGRLVSQLFAGPPNFESIAQGDAEERTLILELPSRICATDGEFIQPNEYFDRIQLSSSDPAILGVLNSAVGHEINVTGEGFGAHTGHHHAPLVMLVEEVSVKQAAGAP